MHPSYIQLEGAADSYGPNAAGLSLSPRPQNHSKGDKGQSGYRRWTFLELFLLIAATIFPIGAGAQQSEPALPISQRQTINLAAGVPEYVANASSTSNAPQSQWWFENTNNSTAYSTPSFVESSDTHATWKQVGLPYDANIPRTFINQTSGGGAGSDTGQENWYRLHLGCAESISAT